MVPYTTCGYRPFTTPCKTEVESVKRSTYYTTLSEVVKCNHNSIIILGEPRRFCAYVLCAVHARMHVLYYKY